MTGYDGLFEIFQPGFEHFAEERDRKRIEAQIPGNDADPNKTWVDLDRGIVHVALPPQRFGAAWSARPEDQPDTPQP